MVIERPGQFRNLEPIIADDVSASLTRFIADMRANDAWKGSPLAHRSDAGEAQGAERPSVFPRDSVSAHLPKQVKSSNRRLRRMASKLLEGQAPRSADERAQAVADGADGAGKWFPVVACGQCPHHGASTITAKQRQSGAMSWTGIFRCGSVWLCAECGQKIEEVRGDEVCRAIETAIARGFVVVMLTHTFPHQIADSCRDSMDGLADATRKMRGRRAYDQFRKSLGYRVLARGTEVTHGWHGWHPHIHEVWFLDPAQSELPIEVMAEGQGKKRPKGEKNALETLIADAVFPEWEAACRKVFGPDRLPSRDHGIDVTVCWSANDYIAKCPDHAKKLSDQGKKRWGPASEVTKTTAKKGRRGSRTYWDILPIAAGEGPSIEEQKAAKLVPMTQERARVLVHDYARGTWRKRRMYYTPSRTARDGTHVAGLRELFNLGDELTDEQIATGELPTQEQATEEREKSDPVSVAVDLDLPSLAAIGRSYLDALQDRLSPTVDRDKNGKAIIVDGKPKFIPVPLLPLLRGDGWLLKREADRNGVGQMWSATHPDALRGAEPRGIEVLTCSVDEPPTAHLPPDDPEWCPF